MTSEQMSQTIREMASRLEVQRLTGLYQGMTMLTPAEVKATKEMRFWQPRAEIPVDLDSGATSFHHQPWSGTDGKIHDLHIYQGGLAMPDVCPVGLRPPSRYDVVEVPVLRRSYRFRANLPQERANRIGTAISSDRYWFAIPFCRYHTLDDRAVHIQPKGGSFEGSQAKALFRNREYARRFRAQNALEGGKWLDTRHIVMRAIGYLGAIIGGSLALGKGMLAWEARGGDWTGREPGQVIAALIVGLIVLAVSVYLMVKGHRGEPL